jgi:endonuclease/exonuclease/phosphatase family metal-dependent hydrolase
MKIVTWNCNGGFRNKFQEIATLEADIYVIQECENPEHSKGGYGKWAENYLWVGENKHKGLGVFASSSVKIEQLDWEGNGLQLFLPVRVNSQFNLVGVWTKYANSPTSCYIGLLWKYLGLHKEKMVASHTVLCGDFNSNKIWDVNKDRRWNHSAVVRELSAINMVSLYHAVTGEEQGAESVPTFCLQRNLQKPYHIDYAFSSKDIFTMQSNTVSVGSHTEWLKLSDHLPFSFRISC